MLKDMNSSFENPCPGQADGLSAYYFTQLVQMLLATHCTLGNPEDYPKDFGNSIKNDDLFDFIIIGGGSSGSVIANRLSEVKNWKILLIEAGEDPTFESDIPSFGVSLPRNDLDWKFETKPTADRCLGMEDETCRIFQGKVLGGTSTINRMHYLRGTPNDYDDWLKAGNDGWGFENVLKYFRKSEKLEEGFKIVSNETFDEYFDELKKSAAGSDEKLYELTKTAAGKFHSKSGLLSVNYFAYNYYFSGIKEAIFNAGEEIQIPIIGDVNRKSQIGFFRTLGTIHEGNRGNTAKAFLSPVKNRQNLFVMKNATVHRIIFKDGRTAGVEVERNGEIINILTKKEVIVSAGAINSPKLLLLSGIGPKNHLQKVGIEVLKDLPGVGKNLQTHITFLGLPVVLKTETKTLSHLQKIDGMYHFISRGTGFFGSVGLNDIIGFIATENATEPDIGIFHYFNHKRDYYTFNELLISLKLKNKFRDQYTKINENSAVLLICPTLLKPNSRGKIELSGSKFQNPVKVYPNFLTDKQDMDALIKGIQFGVKMTQTKAFQRLEPEILQIEIEECQEFAFNSEGYWKCLTHYLATTMHDAAGTCKMGTKDDPFAVVDDRLRVFGVKGLRVADSSIMPKIIRGSVSVGSVMIGEVVSDFIKKEWKKKVRDEL